MVSSDAFSNSFAQSLVLLSLLFSQSIRFALTLDTLAMTRADHYPRLRSVKPRLAPASDVFCHTEPQSAANLSRFTLFGLLHKTTRGHPATDPSTDPRRCIIEVTHALFIVNGRIAVSIYLMPTMKEATLILPTRS